MDEKVKTLLRFIEQNACRESIFLVPDPEHYVYVLPLMDEIGRLFAPEMPKEQWRAAVNAFLDEG